MNKDHVNSKISEVKGRVKEEFGHATGNERLEGEGLIDRVKGKIQEGVGDLKDAVKRGADHLLNKDKKSA